MELMCQVNTQLGMNGSIVTALKSLYYDVSSCVILNGLNTDWFNEHDSLRQGGSFSHLQLNLFINGMAINIQSCQ